MITLKLPFWLNGPELAKLKAAAQAYWEGMEEWLRWPLEQLDPLSCPEPILRLLAFQRDIRRLRGESLTLFRQRVASAYLDASQAGERAGFEAIFERLELPLQTEERVYPIDWDVILLRMEDTTYTESQALIDELIRTYGRTCRRYEVADTRTITQGLHLFTNGVEYAYDAARHVQTAEIDSGWVLNTTPFNTF